MKGRVTVSGLNIYPVKSCAGISVQSATIDRLGFTNDRRVMVVRTADNTFITEWRTDCFPARRVYCRTLSIPVIRALPSPLGNAWPRSVAKRIA